MRRSLVPCVPGGLLTVSCSAIRTDGNLEGNARLHPSSGVQVAGGPSRKGAEKEGMRVYSTKMISFAFGGVRDGPRTVLAGHLCENGAEKRGFCSLWLSRRPRMAA